MGPDERGRSRRRPSAASGGTVASPASTMKRASASTASTPLTLDLYVTEPRSVEPMRLPPSLARLAGVAAGRFAEDFLSIKRSNSPCFYSS